ncbi:hypothetical protein BHM03_00056054, partial [Ensete ventricosum]
MTIKRSYRPDMDPGSSLGIGLRFRRCSGSSLGFRRRYWEDRQEHVGRSLEEDHDTCCRECRRMPDYGSEVVKLGGH